MSRVIVKGDKPLIRKFKALKRGVQNKIMRLAIKAAGLPVVAEAKRRAPVDTGLLQKRIRLRTGRTKQGNPKVDIGVFAKGAYYARFVELGTKHVAPNPFLASALAAKASESGRIATTEASKGVDREFRRA